MSDSSGYYAYVGPTVRSLLQCNTIMLGTKEQAMARAEKAIRKAPTVRQLIVPGSRLQAARNNIKNDINPEAALYKKVLRELKEE